MSISIKNATKTYKVFKSPTQRLIDSLFYKNNNLGNTIYALRDVSLAIPQGQAVALIGKNASGKTTLLNILLRTTYPATGEIITKGKVSAILELGAGFDLELTGKRNIYINASLLGLSNLEIEKRLKSIIEFSELGNFIEMPVKTYSAGMVLRLGFAIAVHVDFDILLVDEVLSVGDLLFQRKCIAKMREFKEQGKTIIMATHNLADVSALCDRVLLLRNGIIEYDGKVEEVIRKYWQECEREQNRINKRLNPFKGEGIYGQDLGDVKILEVKFLDKDRKEKETFWTGESMIVSIKFYAYKRVKNPLFRVQFFRNDGLWVHGSNTYRQGLDLGEVEGEENIELHYETVNLLEASYFVSVGIWPDEYKSFITDVAYDYHEMAYIIHIMSKRTDGGGIVSNPSRWKLKDKKP
jgi:ABC-type polysaccharide/polyol phosphate transport system ATPase subunit